MVKLMTTSPEGAITVKAYNSDSLKIQCIDIEMYTIVQKYFGVTNTEFYSFAVSGDHTLKVVIKGTLSDINTSEVVG